MKKIILFTRYYPYSYSTEAFIEQELDEVNSKYDITLLPFSRVQGQCKDVPESIKINNSCCDSSLYFKVFVVFRILCSSIFWKSIFCKEFITLKSLNQRLYYLKIIFGAFMIESLIKDKEIDFDEDTVFYSYWLTFAPLGFALAKFKGLIKNKTISRTHGYEIYEKTEPSKFPHFPLRFFTYQWIDEVYAISDKCKKILVNHYPMFTRKFKVSRLGVKNISTVNHFNENNICILSCSYLYDLKRVPLIYESLSNFCSLYKDISITWYHIGSSRDDNNKAFDELKELVSKNKHANLCVNLLGEMANLEVIDFYKTHEINVFVNLSTTEGIPVSIMEAASASVPSIATDVGSTNEILNENTGCLLDVNFSQEDFNEALMKIIKNYKKFSCNAQSAFMSHYNAKTNYEQFYNEMTE